MSVGQGFCVGSRLCFIAYAGFLGFGGGSCGMLFSLACLLEFAE